VDEESRVTRVLERKDDCLKYCAIGFNGQKPADSDVSQKSCNSTQCQSTGVDSQVKTSTVSEVVSEGFDDQDRLIWAIPENPPTDTLASTLPI
jgi:hypothetical protein